MTILNAPVDWWSKSHKNSNGPRQSHDTTVHTPHHLLDMIASTDFVSWQKTELVKNSVRISKCRLLINFNFLLALQGKSEQWKHNMPHTYTQVHATCTPVTINSYTQGYSLQGFEILCLFLLYCRRNKSEISISDLFILRQYSCKHLEILDNNRLINAKLIDDNLPD